MPPEEFPSLRTLKEHAAVRNVEIGIQKEDGAVIWTSVSAAPFVADASPATVTVDITARKQAEAQLRQREAQLKTVMDNTPDTILWVDRKGLINFANRLMPGLTEAEVIGSSIYKWVPQEQYSVLARTFEAVFANGKRGEYESLGPGPNGQTRVYDVQVMPVIIDGKTDSAIYTARDITARKRAELILGPVIQG